MKKPVLVSLLFMLICSASFAQKTTVESEQWITENLGHLYFKDGAAYYDFDGTEGHKPRYIIQNDTIKMMDEYTTSADNFAKKHTETFKFLIRYFDGKRLSIKPFNAEAIKLAGTAALEFKNYKSSFDNNIRFSKIHFMSSTCYGSCPQLAIDILPDGTYHLKAGEHAEPFYGDYKGMLSKVQLDSLNYLLKRSELKKMADWQQEAQVADLPKYYFEINFVNNKNKLIITTYQPPINLTELINFMVSSYKKVDLKMVVGSGN